MVKDKCFTSREFDADKKYSVEKIASVKGSPNLYFNLLILMPIKITVRITFNLGILSKLNYVLVK